MAIATDFQLPRASKAFELVKNPACGAPIPSVAWSRGSLRETALLKRRQPAGPTMRGRVEEIPEPGTGADDGGNTERTVLGKLEDLEVVENHRLREVCAQ
jgi:hypothetical protein